METPTVQQQLLVLSESWAKSTGTRKLENVLIPEYVSKSIHAAVLDASADMIIEGSITLWNMASAWTIATTAVVEAIANPEFSDIQQTPLITNELTNLSQFMEQVRKEQIANHRRKAISAGLSDSAKQQFMRDLFELDDGGNDMAQVFH